MIEQALKWKLAKYHVQLLLAYEVSYKESIVFCGHARQSDVSVGILLTHRSSFQESSPTLPPSEPTKKGPPVICPANAASDSMYCFRVKIEPLVKELKVIMVTGKSINSLCTVPFRAS